MNEPTRMKTPLDLAEAWARAVDDFDEQALIGLAHDEIELVTARRTLVGHDGLRDWLSKQSYGVAPRFESRRVFVRDVTVVVDLLVEFRHLDGGESAGSMEAAMVFVMEDDLVRRITPHPDLAAALAEAGLSEADESKPV